MINFRKVIGMRTLKTAVAAGAAVFISNLLGLSYGANSGIIVILSVQNTKKKSSELARQRLIATLIALSVGSAVFLLLGFTPLAFTVYLLVFIPIAVKLGLNDAIVPCSVLVSHLLAIQSVAPRWLANEFMQMVIGAGLALLVNLHIPSLQSQLEVDRSSIEGVMEALLHSLAEKLRSGREADRELLPQLETQLKAGRERSLLESHNYPGPEADYFVRYMDMRQSQLEVLRQLERYVGRVSQTGGPNGLAADLADMVADEVSNLSPRDESFRRLKDYQKQFQTLELPRTRPEFESRASVFEFVSDLELLMEIKRTFML